MGGISATQGSIVIYTFGNGKKRPGIILESNENMECNILVFIDTEKDCYCEEISRHNLKSGTYVTRNVKYSKAENEEKLTWHEVKSVEVLPGKEEIKIVLPVKESDPVKEVKETKEKTEIKKEKKSDKDPE
jgi:hypothetical protein